MRFEDGVIILENELDKKTAENMGALALEHTTNAIVGPSYTIEASEYPCPLTEEQQTTVMNGLWEHALVMTAAFCVPTPSELRQGIQS